MADSEKSEKANKKNASFVNEKGELDFYELLKTKPDLLSSFTHQRHHSEGGVEGDGSQQVAVPFAVATAAARDAQGLSTSYAPLNSAAQVRQMSLSAQYNLGLEASQGLSREMGSNSSFVSEHDASQSNVQKNQKSYHKKLKGG